MASTEFVSKYTGQQFTSSMGYVVKTAFERPDDELMSLILTNSEGQEVALVYVDPKDLRDAVSASLRRQKRLRELSD